MTGRLTANYWRSVAATVALAVMVSAAGCAQPKGESVSEKKAHVRDMASGARAELTKSNPGVQKEMDNAAGWAVFETVQTQLLITATANGFGLAHNNKDQKEYYMKGLGLGAGLGVGIKSSKVIVIFETDEVFNQFVFKGWSFGASGTATAKAVNVEGEAVGRHNFANGVKTYIWTKNGLMAGVSLKGSKVWLDKDLN
jgi:lipid-binding SYLF domain-containing protein